MRFIKLTEYDGETIYVNYANIVRIQVPDADAVETLKERNQGNDFEVIVNALVRIDTPMEQYRTGVRETPQEVIQLIEEAEQRNSLLIANRLDNVLSTWLAERGTDQFTNNVAVSGYGA